MIMCMCHMCMCHTTAAGMHDLVCVLMHGSIYVSDRCSSMHDYVRVDMHHHAYVLMHHHASYKNIYKTAAAGMHDHVRVDP